MIDCHLTSLHHGAYTYVTVLSGLQNMAFGAHHSVKLQLFMTVLSQISSEPGINQCGDTYLARFYPQ